MMTAMEMWETLPEKTRAEVIDDELFMSPSSNIPHVRLQG